ncbi:O-antigen ligase family protein [Halorubrum ezzemoulense]|uniref:O-antigen ligase family protein n=1 Tax=Halorubrum ezzemoulense TaxID=337243 RepID=UPI00233159EC|nr:O-antigen ligase family protein [Halorubrum ezzemoulense]MDB2276118.1 O-antigen ligase family protein [Halorubrum ezzemoulense]
MSADHSITQFDGDLPFQDRRIKIPTAALSLLLLVSIILQYTLLPTSVAYTFISLAYVVLVSFHILHDGKIQSDSTYTKLYLLFTAVVSVRLLFDPDVINVARLLALLTFTTANLFILPSILPFNQFLSLTARVSAVLVAIGFLPYLGFPTQVGFFDLSLWGADIYWYEGLQPITSIFNNPNQLGGLALIGSIGAIHEFFEYSESKSALLSVITIFGLLMTNWRTGWAILVISILLYIFYMMFNREMFVIAVVGSLLSVVIGLLMMFDLVPGPHFLSEFSIGGRRTRWIASVQALFEQPLWGYGFSGITEFEDGANNPHNSYIRIFTGFGIIGGLLYLLIVLGTTVESARRVKTYQGVTLTILLVGFCILQVFNQLTFIGISMRSTIISLMLGYFIIGEVQ